MDFAKALDDKLEQQERPTRVLMRQISVDAQQYTTGDIRIDANERRGRPFEGAVQLEKGAERLMSQVSHGSNLESSKKSKMSIKKRLTQQFARLSSLDSTKTSSSIEMDSSGEQQQQQSQSQSQSQSHLQRGALTPAITITQNHVAAGTTSAVGPASEQQRGVAGPTGGHYLQRHYTALNDTATTDERDGPDEDESDEFSSAMVAYCLGRNRRTTMGQKAAAAAARNHRHEPATMMSQFEILDDRQGMNNSDQQFTRAEGVKRDSIDGISLLSELRLETKKSSLGNVGRDGCKLRGKDKLSGRQRSKSPTGKRAGDLQRNRQQAPKKGCLGLASRLKLTKKHEPIARLQLSILNSGFVSLKTLDRDLKSFLPNERLSVKTFQQHVKLMRKYKVLSTIEYRFASRCYETYKCKHANLEANAEKNSNKKCIPYDYNRVVLKTLPDVPSSDYINASYVDSCLKPNAYIAAQGPNEKTIEDFWRMVWEQKTFVIVMLTKVFDFIRVMCNQYWPVELNKPERYGSIEVTLLYEEPLADFVIRTIKLTKEPTSNRLSRAAATGATLAPATPTPADAFGSRVSRAAPPPRNGFVFADRRAATEAGQGAADETGDEIDDDVDVDDIEYGDDDDDDDAGSCCSELVELVTDADELGGGDGELPPVRAPKYKAVCRRVSGAGARPPEEPRRRRPRSQPALGDHWNAAAATEHRTVRGASLAAGGGGDGGGGGCNSQPQQQQRQQQQQQRPHNQLLLHPFFNAYSSAGDLNSAPLSTAGAPTGSLEPNTPTSAPRTPSSAGLDRSSATRKAVKKKRRARVKNQRPQRTQFVVPDEAQLVDDDDDFDYLNATATGATVVVVDNDDELGGGGGGDCSPAATASPLNVGPSDESRARAAQAAGAKSNERIIYQFHYNSWASHTSPFINSLLHFRRRVRICMDEMSRSGRTGPTIVHCNNGGGRTGTYLCIDANLELVEEDNVVDIFNYTKKMRQARRFLIENLDQYRFVYDTIEEALYCGRTWFPVSELHKRLKHKSQRNPLTKQNEYQREYEKITRMASKFSIGDCAGGHRVENREKNRDVSTVPPDNFRPYLTSFQSNDSTDYVNAVFVDGYTRSKEYIVTEWPLHRTISDFWSLIYDHDCNSVIFLANPGESTNYPSFLPTEKELRRKFGPVFSVEMVSYTHYPNVKTWIYTINKKIVSLTEVIAGVKSEAKTTQVFQITCWPQGHRVPTSTNSLVELMNMVERWRQRTTYGPVCVVSLNGKSRAGVYCAANVAIEQVVQHNEVDVFQAVKTVRRHRPQLIENMTEYKYCYDLILHYVINYLNQASTGN